MSSAAFGLVISLRFLFVLSDYMKHIVVLELLLLRWLCIGPSCEHLLLPGNSPEELG